MIERTLYNQELEDKEGVSLKPVIILLDYSVNTLDTVMREKNPILSLIFRRFAVVSVLLDRHGLARILRFRTMSNPKWSRPLFAA